MVKRLVFILLILPCLFYLTTCDFLVTVFSMSPFPDYLSQAVASVDMTDEIEAYVDSEDSDWHSAVHVLKNVAGDEYVFLIIRKDSGGQRVYALDTDLNLISYDSIDHHYPLALVGASDNFAVGNVLFDHTDMTVTTPYFPDIFILN